MAALASLGALALLLLSGLSCCSAEACVEPQITPSYYTTSDAVISTETVFIVELSVTCKNRVQNMALYADVSGKQFPVTRGQDVGRYQVSWSLDHKSAHAGTYEVRFFDEESYSLLRKVRGTTLLPELWVLGASPSGAGWRGGCLLPAWPAWPCAVFLPPRRWLVFLPPLPTHAPPHCPLTPAPPSQAQRNNEDVSVIPPLFTVSVDHRGTWNGPWVSTEVLAAAIGLVIYYLAFSAKSHIQA
uniref:Translocon-associated protein subunit delta n=1 Tax=Sus scrofa TaxID=9823 RepID=A0A8D1G4K6_PIG